MLIPILMSAAALALPLPPGRSGPGLTELPVVSDPAGATAAIRYRDGHGKEGGMECSTPCTLLIPRNSPFIVEVTLDGRPLLKSRVSWCSKGVFTAGFCPGILRASLPPSP